MLVGCGKLALLVGFLEAVVKHLPPCQVFQPIIEWEVGFLGFLSKVDPRLGLLVVLVLPLTSVIGYRQSRVRLR